MGFIKIYQNADRGFGQLPLRWLYPFLDYPQKRDRKPVIYRILGNFKCLVLGCIDEFFSVQWLILKHFLRSFWWEQSRNRSNAKKLRNFAFSQNFLHFCLKLLKTFRNLRISFSLDFFLKMRKCSIFEAPRCRKYILFWISVEIEWKTTSPRPFR